MIKRRETIMANATIDTSELEYLKSCRDKLRDIADLLDKDEELEFRLKLLTALHGVEIPVASAILALVYPEEYAVIDRFNWYVLYDENRTSFTVNQYKKYLSDIKSLAEKLKWHPQEVDLAIWAYAEKNKISCG